MTEFAEGGFAEVLRCFAGLPYVGGLATLIREKMIRNSQRGQAGPEDAALALIGGVLLLHGRTEVLRARVAPGFPYADLTDAELLDQARLAWAKAIMRDRRKK